MTTECRDSNNNVYAIPSRLYHNFKIFTLDIVSDTAARYNYIHWILSTIRTEWITDLSNLIVIERMTVNQNRTGTSIN